MVSAQKLFCVAIDYISQAAVQSRIRRKVVIMDKSMGGKSELSKLIIQN